MVNLMENAAHYGGGVTEIAVVPGEAEQVEVTVDDAGPGIDPLERLKIFERFYRGSASGRRGTGTGTGLGLALVAEHMRVMQGDVRVESSPPAVRASSSSLPVLAEDDVGDGFTDGLGDDMGNGAGGALRADGLE